MLPKGACFVSSYVHMTVKKVFYETSHTAVKSYSQK